MEEILVDNIGLEQFRNELRKLQDMQDQNSRDGSESYENAVGDGWHDNFSFEESMRESRSIATRIDEMLKKEKYLKLIIDDNKDEAIVNLNDIIKVKMIYSDNDIEEEIIKLTGKYLPEENNDYLEVTLNSPMGKALYKRKIGEEFSYKVNDNEIKGVVIKKIVYKL